MRLGAQAHAFAMSLNGRIHRFRMAQPTDAPTSGSRDQVLGTPALWRKSLDCKKHGRTGDCHLSLLVLHAHTYNVLAHTQVLDPGPILKVGLVCKWVCGRLGSSVTKRRCYSTGTVHVAQNDK
jgi:hypothetical protein